MKPPKVINYLQCLGHWAEQGIVTYPERMPVCYRLTVDLVMSGLNQRPRIFQQSAFTIQLLTPCDVKV